MCLLHLQKNQVFFLTSSSGTGRTFPSCHLHLDVRRTLRKAFIYLVPSPIFLPPPSLCLTGCCAHWLPAWMFDSLSHWTLAGAPLTLCTSVAEAGAERSETVGLLGLWEVRSVSEISPSFCFYWTIKWEQRTALSLSFSSSSLSLSCTDHWLSLLAASMTLLTWMVNGLGFILVWTLCLTQGE